MTGLIVLLKYQFIPKRIKCPFYVLQQEVHESLCTSSTALNTWSSFLYSVSLWITGSLGAEFYSPLWSPALTDTCHIIWAQIYAELRSLKEFILASWSVFEGILVSIKSAQCNFKG